MPRPMVGLQFLQVSLKLMDGLALGTVYEQYVSLNTRVTLVGERRAHNERQGTKGVAVPLLPSHATLRPPSMERKSSERHRPLLLKGWFLDQQPSHHLGTC